MDNNQQTHTIPNDKDAQQRLARLMGLYRSQTIRSGASGSHGSCSCDIRERSESRSAGGSSKFAAPRSFEGMESTWKQLLTQYGFKEVERAFRVLREFVEGPGYVHVSSRTSELAYRLLTKILS
jgi:glutamine synthetase adenylyltransferase